MLLRFFSPSRGCAFKIRSRDVVSLGADDSASDVSWLPMAAIKSAYESNPVDERSGRMSCCRSAEGSKRVARMEMWVELGREGRVEMGGREVGSGIICCADTPLSTQYYQILVVSLVNTDLS